MMIGGGRNAWWQIRRELAKLSSGVPFLLGFSILQEMAAPIWQKVLIGVGLVMASILSGLALESLFRENGLWPPEVRSSHLIMIEASHRSIPAPGLVPMLRNGPWILGGLGTICWFYTVVGIASGQILAAGVLAVLTGGLFVLLGSLVIARNPLWTPSGRLWMENRSKLESDWACWEHATTLSDRDPADYTDDDFANAERIGPLSPEYARSLRLLAALCKDDRKEAIRLYNDWALLPLDPYSCVLERTHRAALLSLVASRLMKDQHAAQRLRDACGEVMDKSPLLHLADWAYEDLWGAPSRADSAKQRWSASIGVGPVLRSLALTLLRSQSAIPSSPSRGTS